MRLQRTRNALATIAAELCDLHTPEAKAKVIAVYNRLKYHRPWAFYRDRATGIVYAAKWSPRAHAYRFLFTPTTTCQQQAGITQAHHATAPLFT